MEISSNCGVSVFPSSGFQSFAFAFNVAIWSLDLHSPLTWVSSQSVAQRLLRKHLFDTCFFPQASPFICDLVVHIHSFFFASNFLIRLDPYTFPSLCFSRIVSSTAGVFSWLAFSVCHNLLWWFYIKIHFWSEAALRTHFDCVRSLQAKCQQPNRPFVTKAISERLWEDGFLWEKSCHLQRYSQQFDSIAAGEAPSAPSVPGFWNDNLQVLFFSFHTFSGLPQVTDKPQIEFFSLVVIKKLAFVLPGQPYHT